MNKVKIGIIIVVITIILVGTIILISNYDKIKENKFDVEIITDIEGQAQDGNGLESYGWSKSGPFYIDKQEYALGEKVFVNVEGISGNDKGQITFLQPFNDTHKKLYLTIPFDGMKKTNFNYFFMPNLDASKEICSTDDLVGIWEVRFIGTEYANINFEIINELSPHFGGTFDPKC